MLSLGFSAIFVRWAQAPGVVTSFYRMLVAVVLLAPAFLRRWRKGGEHLKSGVGIALLGGLLFAADLSAWATGVMLSGANNPTLLANTAPLWVGLGTLILFRERLTARFWTGTALALGGAVLVLGLEVGSSPQAAIGSLLGLLAGLFYGGYFLVTQRGRAQLDSLSYFWLAAAGSAAALLLVSLALGYPLTGYPRQTYLSFAGLGIVSQVIGYLAVTYALGRLPASLVAPSLLGQPVLTALLAWPLLGELVGPFQALGGIAVLAGIGLVHSSRSAPAPAPA